MIRAELLLGDEHAGGGPALAHVAVLPALHVALGVADDLDHALARVRRAQRLGELAGDPEPHQRQRVLEAFAQRAGGVGPGPVELCGEQLEPLLGELGVGQRPRRAHPGADLVAVALGQQIADVALLVALAAMHERVLAEDVADRLAQRLAAVDDEQDRLLGVQAAVDEIGQQRPRERGVLGAAFPEPERDLDAFGADPERDDVRALGDLEAVEHHHRQAHVIQPARHQLARARCACAR